MHLLERFLKGDKLNEHEKEQLIKFYWWLGKQIETRL